MNTSSGTTGTGLTVTYMETYQSDMAMEYLQQASSYYCYTQPVGTDSENYVDKFNTPLVAHLIPNMAAAYFFNRSDLIVNTDQLSTQYVDHTQDIQVNYTSDVLGKRNPLLQNFRCLCLNVYECLVNMYVYNMYIYICIIE